MPKYRVCRVSIHIHVYIYMYIYTYIDMYIYMYIHILGIVIVVLGRYLVFECFSPPGKRFGTLVRRSTW